MMDDNPTPLLYRLLALVFLIGTTWWGLSVNSAPDPQPADSPSDRFSADRAMRHVERIAAEPHMVGTPHHASAREYIVDEMRKLGLEPSVVNGVGVNRDRLVATQIQNVFARMEGTGGDQTIMLMAHYDSVPYAPGAADDAQGVAAILETVRALKAGGPLANDILILITDAEEEGLLGAQQFADTSPELDTIDLVINLEARGSGGPSIMFETNPGNANLIPHYARATDDPIANSISYTIYNLLPNDTDYTIFKERGIAGLNFAFIEEYLNYHTMQDNAGNLSRASLQHHGENMLSVARYFGSRQIDYQSESNLVYFNNPLGGITYYPEEWSVIFAAIAFLVFLTCLVLFYRRGLLSPLYYSVSMGSFLVLLVLVGLAGHYGWQLLVDLYPEYRWQQQGETYQRAWYFWGFISFSLLMTISLFTWLQKKINMHNLLIGTFSIWMAATLVTAWYLPATAYLFTWPALMGLIAWLALGEQVTFIREWRSLLILAAGTLLALFIPVTYVKFIHIAMTTSFIAASMVLVVLMAGIVWPLLHLIIGDRQKLAIGAAALATVICLVGAGLNTGFDSDHKKQNSLIYALNQDTGSAYWISQDFKADNWTSQFLGSQPDRKPVSEFERYGQRPLLVNSATAIDGPESKVSLAGTAKADSLQRVRLTIRSLQPAETLRLSTDADTLVTGVMLRGSQVYQRQQAGFPFSRLYYYADMQQPFSVELILQEPVDTLTVYTEWYHINYPVSLMNHYKPRSAEMMPKPFGFTNGMMWRKSHTIPLPG